MYSVFICTCIFSDVLSNLNAVGKFYFKPLQVKDSFADYYNYVKKINKVLTTYISYFDQHFFV